MTAPFRSVCVYCGASPGHDPLYAEAARALAVGLIAAGGRHVDEATPSADVRLGEQVSLREKSFELLVAEEASQLDISLGELVYAGVE